MQYYFSSLQERERSKNRRNGKKEEKNEGIRKKE